MTAHIITADKRMHFNGRKFTAKGRQKVFATRERATATARELARKFPVLYRHDLNVAPYKPMRRNPRMSRMGHPHSADVLAARKRLLAAAKGDRAKVARLKRRLQKADRV